MITIPLPDLLEHPLDLIYEPTTVRTGPADDADSPPDTEKPAPPTTVIGRITFGGPLAVPITADLVRDDPHLAAFVAGETGTATYHVVHTALSLHTTADQPPFESAHVHLALSNTDGAQQPVAWSVRPLRLADTATLVTGWQFGPRLQLADLVNVEAGTCGEERTEPVQTVYLEGYGELSSEPGWRMNRTVRRPLHGSHRFIMVVRAAAGCRTTVTATVRARVRHRHLWWYRARDVPPLTVPVTLR